MEERNLDYIPITMMAIFFGGTFFFGMLGWALKDVHGTLESEVGVSFISIVIYLFILAFAFAGFCSIVEYYLERKNTSKKNRFKFKKQ